MVALAKGRKEEWPPFFKMGVGVKLCCCGIDIGGVIDAEFDEVEFVSLEDAFDPDEGRQAKLLADEFGVEVDGVPSMGV